MLSDKTGTLTQNDMVFRKICLESYMFTDKNVKKLAHIVRKQCEINPGPLGDVAERIKVEG